MESICLIVFVIQSLEMNKEMLEKFLSYLALLFIANDIGFTSSKTTVL